MTYRIDHAGEARACEEAGLQVMREMGAALAPHMEAVMQFDLARLHAQLALVEQQRIANLIAYVAQWNAQYVADQSEPGLFDEDTYEESLKRREAAANLMREGLGL